MVEGLSYHRASMDPLLPGDDGSLTVQVGALRVPDTFDGKPPDWAGGDREKNHASSSATIMNIIFLEDGSTPSTFDEDLPNLHTGLEQSS